MTREQYDELHCRRVFIVSNMHQWEECLSEAQHNYCLIEDNPFMHCADELEANKQVQDGILWEIQLCKEEIDDIDKQLRGAVVEEEEEDW